MSMLVYGDSRSGNCYKIQMVCAELSLDHDWQEIDVVSGVTRSPDFLAKNPNGRVPLLALADGRYLPESNAIISYLADGSPLAGADRWGRARVLQWMFFEQYSHEPYIAVCRFIVKFLGNPPDRAASLAEKRVAGYRALGVMEGELAQRDYIAGDGYTLADIALYAYTHVAHEGGFDLGTYPAIRSWCSRIEARPGYVPMRDTVI